MKFKLLFLAAMLNTFLIGNVFSDDGQSRGVVSSVLLGNQQKMKAVDERIAKAKQSIKDHKQNIELSKDQIDQAASEKESLETQAALKEQELHIAEKELDVLSSGLDGDSNPESINAIQKAQESVDYLGDELILLQEQIVLADDKLKLAEEQLEQSNSSITMLEGRLLDLKKEKVHSGGWVSTGTKGALIVLIGLLLILILNRAVHYFEDAISEKDAIREKATTLRLRTLSSVIKWFGPIAIVGITIYLLFETFGFNMAPFLAGAGILSLALGFGGQYLIRDIINGIFIVVEGQYRINDVVKIGEHGGLVEAINLRYTRLRDLEGRVIYIPNSKVETVINFTKEYAHAVLDIGVAYKENIDQVMRVLTEIGDEMQNDSYFRRLILDKLEMLGVDGFGDSEVTVKCRIKTLPIKQWEVAREFRRRVKNRFDELDIEIPFPHRTIYQGKEKDMGKLKEWETQQASKDTEEINRSHAPDGSGE